MTCAFSASVGTTDSSDNADSTDEEVVDFEPAMNKNTPFSSSEAGEIVDPTL